MLRPALYHASAKSVSDTLDVNRQLAMQYALMGGSSVCSDYTSLGRRVSQSGGRAERKSSATVTERGKALCAGEKSSAFL